jgi:hypothetical protein
MGYIFTNKYDVTGLVGLNGLPGKTQSCPFNHVGYFNLRMEMQGGPEVIYG